MTKEAIEAIKDKDRIMRKAKKSRSSGDWERAKRIRNEVGRSLRDLRADYLKQQQETHKSDPKKFWKSVSSIVSDKKVRSAGICLKDSLTGLSIHSGKVAENLNSFFSNVGPNLAKNYSEILWGKYG